jgi:hypothetical protein
MYIELHRTAPYPLLANFDAPNGYGAACRRTRSTTPLQALNLLNDPVFFEAAQGLARRVLEGPETIFSGRLERAYRIALGRSPAPAEAETMLEYYEKQKEALRADPERARASLAGNPLPEAAAWVGVSSVLLNLDEFITRE